MRRLHFGLAGFFVFLSFVSIPFHTSAATLNVVSASSRVVVGNIVTVRILVTSTDQPINNAGGTLTFSGDFLKVLSLDTSHSIFPLWIQAPVFSNIKGTVMFNGGVPSPGFTGTAGTVLSVTFQAKKSGIATLSLADASVLANDGLGTEVLQRTGNSTIIIQGIPSPSVRSVVTKPAPNGNTSATSSLVAISPAISATSLLAADVVSPILQKTAAGVPTIPQFGQFDVVTVVLVLVVLQIGVVMVSAHQLRIFQKNFEERNAKTQKGIEGEALPSKEDLKQYIARVEHMRDLQAHAAEEEKLRSNIDRDIYALERFAKQDLETLRISIPKDKV